MIIDKQLLKYNIQKNAEADINNNNFFGSSYIVKQKGETVFEDYFGFTGPEKTSKVSSDTIFRIASMTKPITTVAIMILVDRGIISLDDPVEKYLPEFSKPHIITVDGEDLGVAQKPITIMHLLTHTSGLGRAKPDNLNEDDKSSMQKTVSYFLKKGLDFEPFTKQDYGAFATFDALGLIVEKVTGEDFEDFIKREILTPCHMKDTTFVPTKEQWGRMITLHNKQDGKSVCATTYENCVFADYPCTHTLPGAGLVSTIVDYSNFAEMLLNKGRIFDTQILSHEVFEKIPIPYVPHSIMPTNWRWCLGMRIITQEDYKVLPVGAYGWSGAYGTHFWVDPVNEITAVFMKNSQYDGGADSKSSYRFEEAVFNALK